MLFRSPEALDSLSEEFFGKVCANPNTSTETLSRLAPRAAGIERASIAANPNASPETLRGIFEEVADENEEIMEDNDPEEAVPDLDTLYALHRHENLPEDMKDEVNAAIKDVKAWEKSLSDREGEAD